MRFSGLLFIVCAMNALADGAVVDKVYHPYVVANEREFEWRFMASKKEAPNRLTQRLGYGFAVTEDVAIELYAIGSRDERDDFELTGYEVESRWMLTQQGQYWADWGLVFEAEKQVDEDNYESSLGLIFEKEIGKTSLTMNVFAIREWGKTIESEWESEFRLQYRYRYKSVFQPSFEMYTGEDFIGVGPGFMGVYRIEGQRQIKWDAGLIKEITQSSDDHTFRFAIEYEF